MSQYGKAQYWQQRYSKDIQSFDWYQRYAGIRQNLLPFLHQQNRILNVGAGNSRMSQQMFDENYKNITNIDISQTVIKGMSQKYKQKGPDFKYIQMDVRAMQFPQNSFDLVIDKACLDSILCGEGSTTNASKMLSEINRVLSPTGTYIVISFGQTEYQTSQQRKLIL